MFAKDSRSTDLAHNAFSGRDASQARGADLALRIDAVFRAEPLDARAAFQSLHEILKGNTEFLRGETLRQLVLYLGTLKNRPDVDSHEVQDGVAHLLRSLNSHAVFAAPEDRVMGLWLGAKFDIPSRAHLTVLSKLSALDLGALSNRSLSYFVDALSYLERPDAGCVRAVMKETAHIERLTRFEPDEISRLSIALARMNVSASVILNSFEKRIVEETKKFTSQELVLTAYGFAYLNVENPRVFAAIGRELDTKMHLTSFQLATSLWAFAVGADDLVFERHFRKFVKLCTGQRFSEAMLVQVHQASLGRGVEHKLPRELSSAIIQKLSEIENRGSPSGSNGYELKVRLLAENLGYECRPQEFHDFYWIDIAARKDGEVPIAIEVDGVRAHRVGGLMSGERLGKDLLKDRVLSARGFRVSRVELKSFLRQENQSAYLERALRRAS